MRPILLALLALAACSKSEKAAPAPSTSAAPVKGPLSAEITTPKGTIRCQLLPEVAPETVAAFVGLARGEKEFRDVKTGQMVKRPFYDGLLFHRVIPEFMIQGGDPESQNPDFPHLGTGGPGYTLPDEIAPSVKFDRPGVLAMANRGPGTRSGGSQFFITENPVPRLDGGYTIFGRCGNLDVIKAIARVPRGDNDKPDTPVTMKVKILDE
jgi:peptidyl-prolyl cis-trans isomerase A (cyclophilin A)